MNAPQGHGDPDAPQTASLAMSLASGRGLLSLGAPMRRGAQELRMLEMEIPSISSRVDLSGGTRRFRDRRCRVLRAKVWFDLARLRPRLVEHASRQLKLRNTLVTADEAALLLTAEWSSDGSRRWPVLLRGAVHQSAAGVALELFDCWGFGPPYPGPVGLLPRVTQVLGHALQVEPESVERHRLLIDPLGLVLRWALPVSGWRVPNHSDAALILPAGDRAGVELTFDAESSGAPTSSALPPRWSAICTARERLERAELLLETDPARAEAMLRDASNDDISGPYAERLLLQLLAASAERDEQTLQLADAILARDPQRPAALLARAGILLRRGHPLDAAAAHRRLAQARADAGDRLGEATALWAAGRTAATEAPEQAKSDLNRAVELFPDNPHITADLSRVLAERGEWQQLAALRRRQLGRLESLEQRLHSHLALGEIYRVYLNDAARALVQYQQALEIDPECEPALRGRAEAAIESDRAEEAISALRKVSALMASRGDLSAQVATHLRLASLHEHTRQDDAALAELRQALELRPDDQQGLQQMATLLERLGRHQEAIQPLERLLELERNTAVKLSLELRVAQCWMQLDALEQAKDALNRARELDHDSPAAHRLAVALAERDADEEALLDALEAAAEVERNSEARAQLMMRQAALQPRTAEGLSRAAELLTGAAELGLEDAELARAWDALRQFWGEGLQPQELAQLEQTAASSFEDGQRRARRFVRASKAWVAAGNDERARRCLDRALEAQPLFDVALDALESLVTRQQDGEQLRSVLEMKVEATTKRPGAQKGLLCRLGELLDQEGDRVAARQAYARALAIDAEHPRALAFLGRDALEDGRNDEAVSYYSRLCTTLSRPSDLLPRDQCNQLLVEARLGLARLHRDGGRTAEQEGQLEMVLALAPRHPGALEQLDQLLTQTERHSELIDLLQRRIQITADEPEAQALELRRARLLAATPGRADEAIDELQRLIRRAPQQTEAHQALITLLRTEQRPHELHAAHCRHAEALEQSGDYQAACDRWMSAARVATDTLGDVSRAGTCLHRALQARPADPAVVDALLQLQGGTADELDPALLLEVGRHQLRAGDTPRALRALRAALGPGDAHKAHRAAAARLLLSATKEEAGEGADAQTRLAALTALEQLEPTAEERFELAQLLLERGELTRAAEALAALPADFEHFERANELLARCLEQLQRHQDLARHMEQLADRLPGASANRRRDLLVQAARLWQLRLQDADAATRALLAAAEVTPVSTDLVTVAAELSLPQSPERMRSLVQQMVQRAHDSPQLQAALLCQAAAATLAAGIDTEVTAALLEQALEHDPASRAATELQLQLHEQGQNHQELARTLLRQAEQVDEIERRGALLLRAAELHSGPLGQPRQAVELLQQVATLLPDRHDVTARMAELHHMGGDLVRAEELHVQLARAGQQPEENLRRALAIARSRQDRDAQASHLAALRRHGERPELLRELADLHAQRGDPLSRAEVLEALLGHDDTVLLELADLEASELGHPRAALALVRRLLQRDPGNRPALQAALRLATTLEHTADRAQALSQLSAVEPDPWRQLEQRLELARLYDQMGQLEQAEQPLRDALEQSDADPQLVRQLVRTLARQNKWAQVQQLLEPLLEAGKPADTTIRAELAAELAQVLLEQLDDDERARRWLEQACALVPQGPWAQRLTLMLHERGDHAALCDLLSQQAEVAPQGEQRAAALEALALLQETQLHDPRAAAASFELAYLETPAQRLNCAAHAQELYARSGLGERALALLESIIPAAPETIKGELLLKRARLLASRGTSEEALQAYRWAVEQAPELAEASAELGRRLFETGQFRAALPHLQRALQSGLIGEAHDACVALLERANAKVGLRNEQKTPTRRQRNVTRRLATASDLEHAAAEEELPLPAEGGPHKEDRTEADAAAETQEARRDADTPARAAPAEVAQQEAVPEDGAADQGPREKTPRKGTPTALVPPPQAAPRAAAGAAGAPAAEAAVDAAAPATATTGAERAVPLEDRAVPAEVRHGVAPGSPTSEWMDLADRLTIKARSAASPTERADLLIQAARVLEDQLDLGLDAYRLYEQASAAAPTHRPAVEALADAAYRSQNWHHARELYQQLWELGSSLPRQELAYRRGLVHETLGDGATAEACYNEALTVDPAHRSSLEGRTRVALNREDPEAAIAALEGLAAHIPVDQADQLLAARTKLGEMYLKIGDFARAKDCLESALFLDPTHAKVMQTLLPVYQNLGEYSAMAELLDRLVRMSTNSLVRASLLHYRAEILGGELGDEDAAVDCLLRAYDLAPHYPPTLWRLVDYYWDQGDLQAVADMGANLRRCTDLLAEQPDPRHVRLAVASVATDTQDPLAVEMFRVVLRRPDLVEPALQELAQAVSLQVPAEALAQLACTADPTEELLGEAQALLQQHPPPPGLAQLVRAMEQLRDPQQPAE